MQYLSSTLNWINQIKDDLCARRKSTKKNPHNLKNSGQNMIIQQRTEVVENNHLNNNKLTTIIQNSQVENQHNQLNNNKIQVEINQYPQINIDEPNDQNPQQTNQQVQVIQYKPLASQYILQKRFHQQQTDQQDDEMSQIAQSIIRSQINIDQSYKQCLREYEKIQQLKQENLQIQIRIDKSVAQFHYNQNNLQYEYFLDQQNQGQVAELDDKTLMRFYQRDIQNTILCKYTNQLHEYPLITFQRFAEIVRKWQTSKKTSAVVMRDQTGLNMLDKLTQRSFKTLSFGSWLNDQIINGYLQMIEKLAVQKGTEHKYRILNSFMVQTTLGKSQQNIKKTLGRKKITSQNPLIIALNNNSHWFFCRIIYGKVTIYDSISHSPQYYTTCSTKQTFKKILAFADWFYPCTVPHFIQVNKDYPQQNNSYDCGMFLLSGIKDVVRGKKLYTFGQQDINYRRVQTANQLWNMQINTF